MIAFLSSFTSKNIERIANKLITKPIAFIRKYLVVNFNRLKIVLLYKRL